MRPIHILLSNGEDIIVSVREHVETGDPVIPMKLLYSALWIYDIEGKKVLKNKTDRKYHSFIAAKEVDSTWLTLYGFGTPSST